MPSQTLPRGTLLLLFPEDVNGIIKFPAYATIKSSRGTSASAILEVDDDDIDKTVKLSRAKAVLRKVCDREAEGSRLGTWLRQAVCVKSDGLFVYGQVTGHSNASLTITTLTGPIEASADSIYTTVYPVVAMVMGCHRISEEEWPREQLEHVHDAIMDRLLAPREEPCEPLPLASLIQGLLPEVSPGFDRVWSWVDSRTGHLTRVSIQHVINHVFYVDGEKPIPSHLKDGFGPSFSSPINTGHNSSDGRPLTTRTRHQHAPHTGTSTFFDAMQVDDDVEAAEDEATLARGILLHDNVENQQTPAHHNRLDRMRRGEVRLGTSPSRTATSLASQPKPAQGDQQAAAEAEIHDLIRLHKPHLLPFHRPYQHTPVVIGKRQATSPVTTSAVKRSKYIFQPSFEQQMVHDVITSETIRGKSPSEFVESLVSCSEFWAYPGVAIRAFDFEFGSRGLSFLHFAPANPLVRLQKQRECFINMNDFSVAAKFMPASDPTTWDEILAAANGFQQYCFTRCDPVTQELSATLYSFVVQLKASQLWQQDMLLTLVLWIDAQLEKYRSAVISDIEMNVTTRHLISASFTPNHIELHGLILAEQRNRTNAMLQSTTERQSTNQFRHQRTPRQINTYNSSRKDHHDAHPPLPQLDGKDVCIKFLSKKGCPSSEPDCTPRYVLPPSASRDVSKESRVTRASKLRDTLCFKARHSKGKIDATHSGSVRPLQQHVISIGSLVSTEFKSLKSFQQKGAGRISSVGKPQLESLQPFQQDGAGRTSSVGKTQFESLQPFQQDGAGRTSSVGKTQIESLQPFQQDGAERTNSVGKTQLELLQPFQHQHERFTPSSVKISVQRPELSNDNITLKHRHDRKSSQVALQSNRHVDGRPHSREVQNHLKHALVDSMHTRMSLIMNVCSRLGIEPPKSYPERNSNRQWQLDAGKQRVLTALAVDHGFSLQEIVELVRGQTRSDVRPNKAIFPSELDRLLEGYEHKDLLVAIARSGIEPSWKENKPLRTKPSKNHNSASRYLNGVLKSIRKGQDSGHYLVLSIDVLKRWTDIQISPLGAVPKKDSDPQEDIRLIHDLSFPHGSSTNDMSRSDLSPEVVYQHVATLARRIVACRSSHTASVIKILKGDVKGAFKHLMLASGHVKWMAATLPEMGVLVIDMSAPFGWTSSPAYYGIFGGAITWLVKHESPASMDPSSSDHEPFFGYEWVDDHVLIEPDIDNRLHLASETLRLAMLAILGPESINEQKFSSWETNLQVLGLEFNTDAYTITMPEEKIRKALNRITALNNKTFTTKTILQQLLGSLRHVCSCLRAAKPFYQRLHTACTRASRYDKVPVDDELRLDLQWFEVILRQGKLQKLPLTMYSNDQPTDVHLYMDASNSGLVVLNPASNQYIQLKFDAAEQLLIKDSTGQAGFNINVREQFCVALAAWIFGPAWESSKQVPMMLITAWSDNTSAVAWTNKLCSANPLAQEVNRAIGLAEAVFGFRAKCSHLPGSINTMADAGSRAWSPPNTKTLYEFLNTLQSQALATDSRPKYAATWKRWSAWCSSHDFIEWLPSDVQEHSLQLALFAIHYWYSSTAKTGKPLSTKTVLSAISHISWYHIKELGYPVGLHAGHKLAVRGMQRMSPPPRQKQPVTLAILSEIRSRCDFKKIHDRVLWGAAVVGFFFLLRRSEYLADGKRTKPYIIRVDDIRFITRLGATTNSLGEASAVSVHFRGSKTDQAGAGTSRTLHRSGSPWLCPVLASWELVKIARRFNSNAALCSTGQREVLSAKTMGDTIKDAAAAVGADPSRFGTHSMRSGGATAMFAAGVDRLTIKIFGRWSSDAFELYTRMNDAVSRSLAHNMTQGAMSRVSPATPEGLCPAQHS